MKTAKLARLVTALALGLTLISILVLGLGAKVVLSAPLFGDLENGDTITPTQTISGTWGPGTITATSDVVINPGVVIVITPNTTIRAENGVGFTISGTLRSDGYITFTTANSPTAPGNWTGIVYALGSSGYLDGATIEYAEQGLTLNTTNLITVSNSIIRYNRYAPSQSEDAFGAGIAIMSGSHLITNT